jgi:hypothetical protein
MDSSPDEHPAPTDRPLRVARRIRLLGHESSKAAEEPLRCVWSGYPDYERNCRSRIPASVVVKAWQRETQVKGVSEGFFYFSWRNGTWLAFGSRDGGVRGIYCPTHCSERDSREPQGEHSHEPQRSLQIAVR